MDFIGMVMTGLFISFFDWVAYTLLSASYSVFLAVSQVNIFATEGGMEIFSTVSKQIYTIIGIAMVFVFAYQLILLIIDPDGGNKKAPSKLFFDAVFSMVLVLVMPTIFNYMTVFQEHVLKNGTIPAIILGTTATTDIGDDAGNKIAMMVLTAFYHPENSTYTTFYDENGELRGDAQSKCTGEGNPDAVCTAYVDALNSFESDHKIASITGVASLREAVYKDDKGMAYMWLLSTVAAVVVAWFFITYSIDIGARAVKLGFLQLIAPAPVILRIFPQSRKSFEVWFGEIKKTYLEIFIRLAVIFFIVRLIQILPSIVGSIFDSTSGVVDSIILKCVALVLLILGLLKFAQEAPELFKTMFDTGGNLFKGMNLKPGVRKHIEDNKFGMAAATGVIGATAGFMGGMRNAYHQSKDKTNAAENGVSYKNLAAGLYGGVRGAVSGAVHGVQNPNEKLSGKEVHAAMVKHSQHAAQSHNDGNYFENIARKVSKHDKEIQADPNNRFGKNIAGRALAGAGWAIKSGVGDPLAAAGKKAAGNFKEVTGMEASSASSESVAALKKIMEPVMTAASGGAQLVKQGQQAYETDKMKTGSAMQNITFDSKRFQDANGQIDQGKVSDLAKALADRKVEGATVQAIMDAINGGGQVSANVEMKRGEKTVLDDIVSDSYKTAAYEAMADSLKGSSKEVVKSLATVSKTQNERAAQIGDKAIQALNKEIQTAITQASKLGLDGAANYATVTDLDSLVKAIDSRVQSGHQIGATEALLIESVNKGLSKADSANQFKPKDDK